MELDQLGSGINSLCVNEDFGTRFYFFHGYDLIFYCKCTYHLFKK